MGNDKTKGSRGSQTARPTAWERNQTARRDAARDPSRHATAPRAAHRQGTGDPPGHTPRDTARHAAGGTGREATDAKGIRGVESRTGEHTAQTPNGRGAGGAGDQGGAPAESEAERSSREARQRHENAAREQPLYAARRAQAGPVPPEPVDADAEQIDDGKATEAGKETLAKLIGSMVMTGSRLPAQKRNADWPPGPNGEPPGAFWYIPEDEAMSLGYAWAAVIAEFAPVEMIGGASVLLMALMTTSFSLVPRIMTDAERARQFGELQRAAAARQVEATDAAPAAAA